MLKFNSKIIIMAAAMTQPISAKFSSEGFRSFDSKVVWLWDSTDPVQLVPTERAFMILPFGTNPL